MLVLSRLVGEAVYINGNIKVVVVAVDRGKVRLGIEAPQDVRVDREEVYHQRKKNENTIAKPA